MVAYITTGTRVANSENFGYFNTCSREVFVRGVAPDRGLGVRVEVKYIIVKVTIDLCWC